MGSGIRDERQGKDAGEAKIEFRRPPATQGVNDIWSGGSLVVVNTRHARETAGTAVGCGIEGEK